MTLQEIKERIAKYESKWGKLGHTNIMKPENEIQHSALNERRNTMIKTTNDFYKFRQKVAIGKEANKLAHKATISPEELNERNFQNQIDNNTLIHAGKNFKYVAKEDINGRPRYFYTQEEYNAFKRGDQTTPNTAPGVDNKGKQNAGVNDYKQRSQAAEDFDRENDKRWAYEVSKNRKSGSYNWERKMLADEKGKSMDKDLKYVDSLKKDVSEGVRDVIHDHKNPVGKLMDYIEDAFEDDELRMDKDGNMTGDEKVIAKIQEMSKEAEKYGKNLGANFGEEGGNKVWNEFQKQTGDRVSKLTRAYNVKDEALKAYDENGEDGVADYLIGTDEWKKMEKEVRKAIGDGKLRVNRDNSGFNKLSKDEDELLDDLYEEIDGLIDVVTDGTGINRKAIGDLLGNELINLAASHSETKYETNSNGKDNYNTSDKKFNNTNKETNEYQKTKIRKMIENEDRKRENSRKNNGSRSVYGKDNNPERDRYAKIKHSAFDEEDETPSYKTAADLRQEREESIMSEYRAFKARANKGAEKNRLSHSAVISAKELNAKYEEELMKEYIAIHPENDDFESLSHAGQNYKYFAKVDLGNGNSRYFYTKEEYDAYNQPKKTTTTLVTDKKPLNSGSLEATKKYHQEKAKEAKEAPYKNAAKTAGKELNMERALDKAWDSAEDSIKDKVKSRTKAMKDLADKYDVNHPFAKNFDGKLEEIKNNWNKKINDEADKIEEKYGKEDIWQNEEAQKFAKDVYSKGFKELEDALNAELDKQEASYKALADAGKAWQKFDIAWDEIKELSKYDKQVLADEMGLDSFDEEDILNKYYIVEDDKAWREAHANDEDYGKAEFEKEAQGLTDFWNDYKAAKKSLGHSAFDDEDDEDSLSHNSNGYGGTYLHKLDDFYGPGKPRYFYSEADWNAYQEGLKRNSYNADKEAEARQAKTDKQKADLARRSGMENYTKYQENKRADEEADARQAKIDEQKTRAKQKAGMEGYEEWNEKRQAEKEANAKKVAEDRNDMSGYAAWKRRRDYINNQKKASEAAEAKEAEKHEIEKKAVKNSVEVAKNKAAAKAQEAAEAEKHEAESAKRIAEERRAENAKKNAESKEAAMKAGQKSTMQETENAARDKEHKADKEKAKWNNLNNNVTSILEKASKKYDNQLEALNKEYESIKDKSSPEAKAVKDKISQTHTKKDAELDKEIMTVVKDLGEIFNDLEDKNGPEAKLLRAQARRALDYSSNTKLAKVMGETNAWINAGMKHPKEV